METQKLNLLILEDNETDAMLIQRMLERSGMNFEATIVNNEPSFLSAIQNETFDIILCDNYLPQFDATAAIQLIRENKINTPIILVTGTVSEGFAASMLKTGACDYILKDRLQRLPGAIINAVEWHMHKTKQKKDLDDLVKSEASLRTIIDNTNVGFALLDASFNIVLFNHAVIKCSTAFMEQLPEKGNCLTDLLKPEHKQTISAMLHEALEGVTTHYEIPCTEPGGTVKSIDISFCPVKNTSHEIAEIIMSVTDISNR